MNWCEVDFVINPQRRMQLDVACALEQAGHMSEDLGRRLEDSSSDGRPEARASRNA